MDFAAGINAVDSLKYHKTRMGISDGITDSVVAGPLHIALHFGRTWEREWISPLSPSPKRVSPFFSLSLNEYGTIT